MPPGHSGNCAQSCVQDKSNVEYCPYDHAIPICEACRLGFDNEDEYQYHLTTNEHSNPSSHLSYCSICQTNVGQSEWINHVQGPDHYGQACDLGVSPDVQPQLASSTNDTSYCELCEMAVDNGFWDAHLGCAKHLSRWTFVRYTAAVEATETDKHGIAIEGVFDFDCIAPKTAKCGVKKLVTIRATQQFTQCILLEFKLSSPNSGFRVDIENGSLALSATKSFTLSVVFKQAHPGRYEDRLEFIFQDTRLNHQFIITRPLNAVVGDSALLHELMPKEPYIPRKQSAKLEMGKVVQGAKPAALKAIRYKAKLPEAAIPKSLHDLLSSAEPIAMIKKEIKQILPEFLTSANYGQFFKNLLWIEEMKMEQELIQFDMTDVMLNRHGNYYFLPVPGLAEKRPDVQIGDSILVQEHNTTDKWFEGHIHVIRKAQVGVRFHASFHESNEGKRFHVRFKLGRLPIRRQHQALDVPFFQDRVLFPEKGDLPSGRIRTNAELQLNLVNPLIAKNEPQIQAIISILSLPPGSPPFIVFGPPGTGKTLTIVEAMQQIVRWHSKAKILACAPSNSAADLIASRLASHLSPKELFRFYAPSRPKDSVPDDLQEYVYTDDNGAFSIPSHPSPKAALSAFRVIVTTCQSGSIAFGIGLPKGLFTHIFIDEAGQATEPEALLSIRTMADAKTNVVLSGDPKQLGPIIRSKIAMDLGLGQSYLERLMTREAYNLKPHTAKSVVKLTKNFRSHQAILSFPNQRFYNGDLEQCADSSTINYLNTSLLPSKQFPIVFHAISGKDDRESTSPSFFNIDEISVVRTYVMRLKNHRTYPTAEEDIGIISPYHAQCSKLRANLNADDRLKIGSVEEFQGQERKVIIISTVRSSKNFVEYDLRHTLGFVANPRRFNVAITRAQALLIVVGDPNVLSLDPLWRSFLNYVYLNGGWKGPDITWNPTDPVNEGGGYDKSIRVAASAGMEEFTMRMERLQTVGMGEEGENEPLE